MTRIRAGIVGYGNLGRSVEQQLAHTSDFELTGIYSRRAELDTSTPVYSLDDLTSHSDQLDLLFNCLGSATDVPELAPALAKITNTVDTYDNHHHIPAHRAAMDAAARETGHVAMICTGWDPGMFSINRTIASSLFPQERVQSTFWGPGVSQGHSDAVRRVAGVKAGVQYTLPRDEAVEAAARGETVEGTKAHLRDVYVVADEADHERIEREICSMPDYFEPYETRVTFVTQEQFDKEHTGMPHGGQVVTSGVVGETRSSVRFGLELERNPDFTAACQVAYGRAAVRMAAEGKTGAVTVLEVAPYLLAPEPLDELVERDI